MDELDVRILRSLMSESAVAPSDTQVNSSLRSIAARLGADDMTVNNRYRRLQESGAMSGWQLIVNPTFFGCKLMDATVDVEPESAKADMVRKLKLVHEVVGMVDFFGKALKIMVAYGSDESRARTIELASRITGAERITQVRWALPQCRTERLTETDVAIIRALSHDARRSFVMLSKELGLSTRTVRNRVARLRRENTVFALPILNLGAMPGLIPAYLSYSYANREEKGRVDRAMLARFEASYIAVQFSDPASGYVLLSVPSMAEVRRHLEWAKSQPGVTGARMDILTNTMMFPEKLTELLEMREERAAIQRKAFF